MKRGDRVELRGFGAFSVRIRRPRTGRNPRTGTIVQVGEKVVLYFKTNKEMRDRINLFAPDGAQTSEAAATLAAGPKNESR